MVMLSVIIVNYNVCYFLEQCLHAVLKASSDMQTEIIVIDNNSSDPSREYLPARFPSVHFEWLSENLGFGKANNLGIKKASGDHILFLNPDTIVPEDCFSLCLDFFNTHPDAGGLGVRMISGDGVYLKESKRGLPTASSSFFKMTGLEKLFPNSKTFASYYASYLPTGKTGEVDVLAGAFMMMSRRAIDATQGFDEAFFMYGEDVDLSYRIQRAGFKNYFLADTTILHFKGESTQRFRASYANNFYGAMGKFVHKHYQQAPVKKNMMLAAIGLGKMIAKARILVAGKPATPIETAHESWVVCTQRVFDNVIQLLKFASPSLLISARVAPGDIAARLMHAPRSVQCIFCEEDMSWKSIIQTVSNAPRKAFYLFHGKDTGSVVGSSSSKANGLVITAYNPDAIKASVNEEATSGKAL